MLPLETYNLKIQLCFEERVENQKIILSLFIQADNLVAIWR